MRNDFNIKPHDKEGYVFIAGAPRSGTQFIAQTFQAIGVDLQHEAFGSKGISAFHIVPHLSQRKHGLVLQQTRDTLKVISSMQAFDKSWPYLTEHTGISPTQGGRLHAIMRLYLRLNSEIEKYEHFRYKVEEINIVWEQMLDIINIDHKPMPELPTNTHTRVGKYKPLTWAELEFRDAELTKYIKDMAIKYGYELRS